MYIYIMYTYIHFRVNPTVKYVYSLERDQEKVEDEKDCEDVYVYI